MTKNNNNKYNGSNFGNEITEGLHHSLKIPVIMVSFYLQFLQVC